MKIRFYILAFIYTFFLLSSCVPTHRLAQNEKLLFRIKINGVNKSDPEKIASLYQQLPNRKILFSTPYLSIYYFGKHFYNPESIKKRIETKRARADKRLLAAGNDSSKVSRILERKERRLAKLTHRLEEGNVLMTFGEPPSIYDSLKTVKTVEQIRNYLFTKGYFRNKISFKSEEKNKKITLTFDITENAPFTYSQVNYIIPDTAIKSIIDSTITQSLIKVNQNYDEEILVAERERLELLLKNHGYFNFRKQYITINPDTSFEKNKARLDINISNEENGAPHQVFRLGQVNFIADASYQNRFGLMRDTISYHNVNYLAYRHRISPRILDKKITIRPGQLYSETNSLLTQRQLLNLDMYRFININFLPGDSSAANLLSATLSATPNRRFQETTELGASYSASLPGPFANFRLAVRNVFGGAEILEIGLRGGLEGQFSTIANRQAVYSTELGGNLSLIFPQFLVPFNANKYFSRFNPRTRLNVNFTSISRTEFTRTNQETSFDYIWQVSPKLQYVFTPFDVSLISSGNLSEAFTNRLIQARSSGNKSTYERSFTNSFVSSLNFSRLYNSNNFNHTLDATYLRIFLEEAGLVSSLALSNKDYLGKDSLKLFKFARVNIDYRRYLKLSRTNFLVSRFNFGLAKAFNKIQSEAFLPYDKYYYAGGGTSVRAFRPRRLGPGSYFAPQKSSTGEVLLDEDGSAIRDLNSEQQGELLIEGNLEYRFNIYDMMNGAFFIDAGNIWMITNDEESRPGSTFKFNKFYKEFAVGTGIGLRFDFTFLIARLDLATKVYDPALSPTNKYVIKGIGLGNIFSSDRTVFNLGIGYPF